MSGISNSIYLAAPVTAGLIDQLRRALAPWSAVKGHGRTLGPIEEHRAELTYMSFSLSVESLVAFGCRYDAAPHFDDVSLSWLPSGGVWDIECSDARLVEVFGFRSEGELIVSSPTKSYDAHLLVGETALLIMRTAQAIISYSNILTPWWDPKVSDRDEAIRKRDQAMPEFTAYIASLPGRLYHAPDGYFSGCHLADMEFHSAWLLSPNFHM